MRWKVEMDSLTSVMAPIEFQQACASEIDSCSPSSSGRTETRRTVFRRAEKVAGRVADKRREQREESFRHELPIVDERGSGGGVEGVEEWQ